MEIIPAIIPQSFKDLEHDVLRVAPYVSRVQVDVMDGHYTPEASWPYNRADEVFDEILRGERSLSQSDTVAYEVDMMVLRPETQVENWLAAAGVTAVIIHLESTTEMRAILGIAHHAGKELGIAILPRTPLQLLEKWVSEIDFVQCMGNDKIGFHGVPLNNRVYDHLSVLRKRYPALTLGVDIGVNLETAPKLVAAGATRLVSGSAIFKSGDIAATIKQLQNV